MSFFTLLPCRSTRTFFADNKRLIPSASMRKYGCSGVRCAFRNVKVCSTPPRSARAEAWQQGTEGTTRLHFCYSPPSLPRVRRQLRRERTTRKPLQQLRIQEHGHSCHQSPSRHESRGDLSSGSARLWMTRANPRRKSTTQRRWGVRWGGLLREGNVDLAINLLADAELRVERTRLRR